MLYTLYRKPKSDNNSHLIYNLSRDKIVVTMKYQSVSVLGDLIEPMNKSDSSNNKIRDDHFDIKQSIVREDYSNNNKYDSQTTKYNKNNFEDGDTDKLGNSQHLDDLMSDKIIDHEDQIIRTWGKSTITFTEIYNFKQYSIFSKKKYYCALSQGLCTYLFSCENISVSRYAWV